MKTKLIIASAILFATTATSAFAEATWIGNSAVNVNGIWYYAGGNGTIIQKNNNNWQPSGGNFQSSGAENINLGEISTLHIGGQCQVADNGQNWEGTQTIDMMYYKIDNNNEIAISLTKDDYGYGQYANNMHFQSGGAAFAGTEVPLTGEGFEPGSVHTLSVRFQCDNQKDPGSDYYVARFKIKEPTIIYGSESINVSETPDDVKVKGLTLYKDGYWNTLCLPFTLTKGDVQMSELSGAEIRKLENGSVFGSTLTLNFSTSLNPAEGTDPLIEAGKPYIIKWSGGTNIEDPVFTNVKVSVNKAGSVPGTGVTFKGTFDQITFEKASDNILFVGDNNTLYYPDNGAKILPFRAYFELDTSTGPVEVKSVVLNFDDDTNSIQTISNETSSNDDYYTIDGRRLNEKPATAGLYIINGKKIIIK